MEVHKEMVEKYLVRFLYKKKQEKKYHHELI